MADNIAITPGSGANVRTDDVGGIQYQVVKLDFGGDGVSVLPSVNSGTKDTGTLRVVLATDQPALTTPMPVADGGGSLTVDWVGTDTMQVKGSVGHDGVGTGASPVLMGGYASAAAPADVSADGDATRSWVLRNGAQATVITAAGALIGGDAANGLDVDVTRVGGTVTVAGTVTTTPPSNASTNVAQVAGTAADVNSGNKSAGTLRVVLATDQPQLTNKLLVTPDANAQVDVNKIAGTATAVNSGNKDAGTQRVVLATDQPALTNALKTTQTPAASGGLSTFHLESAASTNATNIKASAGQVFGWFIYNSNAAARKVAFHNASGTPTAGASIFFTVVIPPLSAANVEFTNGIAFSTGIAITTVTGLADNNSTAVAADDLNINIFYA